MALRYMNHCDVACWHETDIAARMPDVRFRGESVAKLPKCRGINFPEMDQTSRNRRTTSLQAVTEVAREFIAG
jgi:hypothetical protein